MALLVLYLIPLLIISIYPLVFAQFGDVYLLTSYGSILAFFIMGAALIAVGVFISSLTDNQGLAAGIGIAVILLNYTDSLIEEHYYPIMPLSQGLVVDSTASSVTELLTTSDASFSKVAGYDLETYEKEEGDIDGPFAVAVSIDSGNDGRIVWFSSSSFLDDTYNAYSSGANVNLGMNAVSSMIGESEAMAIRSKSLNYNYLTISNSTSSLLKVMMIGVFPLVYLGIGIAVVLRRRRMQNEAV